MAARSGAGRAVRRGLLAVALALAACGQAGVGALVVPAPDATLATVRPAATAPPSPRPTEGPADLDGLDAALEAIAAAFLAHDPGALEPWLLDPESAFGRRWLERAENLADVPLAHYALRLDDSLPDLATDAVRGRYRDPVTVRYVVEEHALEGFDPAGPAEEDLFLTFVDTAEGWRVAGDEDGEDQGLISVDHLWDQGPVAATRDGPILALHHPGDGDVAALLDEARAALAAAAERWPLAWPERVAVIVPSDQEELAELLHVTFPLDDFIAFASSTPVGELGEWALTGPRVLVNPDRFLARSSAVREQVLVHELLHVATRPAAGPAIPSWLEEGVAQALGEQRSTTGTRLLDALVASGSAPDLPTDAQFVTGGRDRIFLSYQLAWSFIDDLRSRYGAAAVARFYEAAGQGAVGAAGTDEHLVDRAAREVFDRSLAELVSAWRAG